MQKLLEGKDSPEGNVGQRADNTTEVMGKE